MRYTNLNAGTKILSVILFLLFGYTTIYAQPSAKMRINKSAPQRTTYVNNNGTVTKYSSVHPSCKCVIDTLDIDMPDGTVQSLYAIHNENKNRVQKDTVETLISGKKNMPVDVYENLDEMPKYKNGNDDLKKYIESNLKFNNNGKRYSGHLTLNFIVMKNGKIENVKIDKTYSIHPEELERDINRILKNMPPWKPGKLDGKAVNTYYNFQMLLVI